ncbi:MAG: DUF4261 domain-containing protein [Allosphingosinicella sp.]
MPILLLNRPIAFPVAAIRKALSAQLPEMAWRVGEEDSGAADQSVPLDRTQTILGRAKEAMVLIAVEQRHCAYEPANGHVPPRHRLHLSISRPSTDDDEVARLITLIIGASIAAAEDDSASLQLEPGGNWHGMIDMKALLRSAEDDPGLAQRDLVGTPESFDREQADESTAPPAETLPVADSAATTEAETLGGLASFSILLDGDVFIDWPGIDDVLRKIDPEGGWTSIASPGGLGFVTGRSNIVILWSPLPMDAAAIDDAYLRSFWFDGDRARVARHRQFVTLQIESHEDYADRLMTAKIATVIVGAIASLPQAAAVFNHEITTIFSPEMAKRQVGILHSDELPIQLWTWTAPNSMADGNVCLTTGGFAPLLGFEVEVWNAPHPVNFVAERLSETLRYLLIKGPVIAHGDTIGTEPGDRSIRCFFGESRVSRPRPTKAMFLEFDTGAVAQPRKDLPLPSLAQDFEPSPIRRAGGFGRKGL